MIPALLPFIGPVVNKILDLIPDPAKREAARLQAEAELRAQEIKLIELIQQSDLAQAKINEVEAASADRFKSWSRPAAMWIAVFGLAWNVLPVVVGQFFVWFGHPAPIVVQMPEFVIDTLLYGLLGLGAYRTYEKKSNVTK